FHSLATHPLLPSFPTRRSSDLIHLLRSRTANRIASGGALRARRWNGIRSLVEPTIGRRIVEDAEAAGRHEVDALRHERAALADIGRRDCQGEPAAEPNDALHLPAA